VARTRFQKLASASRALTMSASFSGALSKAGGGLRPRAAAVLKKQHPNSDVVVRDMHARFAPLHTRCCDIEGGATMFRKDDRPALGPVADSIDNLRNYPPSTGLVLDRGG
jgi:hypothetical protein